MATVLCALSGIEFPVPHFNYLSLSGREAKHPIFTVPHTRLLPQSVRWLDGELTHTENYLLYLALWNSTGLCEFRVPATMCADTVSLVAQNMDRLVSIVERIHDTGTERIIESLHLPKFVISPDTKDLTCTPDWITIWENCYKDYETNYVTSTALEKLTRKEATLERYIKDRNKDIASYAHPLAVWAADAGQFPEFSAGLDSSILAGKNMSLRDYWIHIIKASVKLESIWDIPTEDIRELIEHCEEHIGHGTIYAHELMTLLRAGLERKNSFFNLGDIDVGTGTTTFRILDASSSIEDANKLALIDAAPLNAPVESQYPNKLAYLKAKMNWQMKLDYMKEQG